MDNGAKRGKMVSKWDIPYDLECKMRALGFRESHVGTDMLRFAVLHWRPGIAYTKELYPLTAKAFRVSPAAAERDMRYALTYAWAQPEPEYYQYYYGKGGLPMPGLSEFIARMAREGGYWYED